MNFDPCCRGDQAGEGRLAGAGRPPEDERRQLGARAAERHAQERLLADDIGLAHEFIEGAGPHPFGQRRIGARGGEFLGGFVKQALSRVIFAIQPTPSRARCRAKHARPRSLPDRCTPFSGPAPSRVQSHVVDRPARKKLETLVVFSDQSASSPGVASPPGQCSQAHLSRA